MFFLALEFRLWELRLWGLQDAAVELLHLPDLRSLGSPLPKTRYFSFFVFFWGGENGAGGEGGEENGEGEGGGRRGGGLSEGTLKLPEPLL